jgi:predicted GTPase
MGYSEQQRTDLEDTINASDADVVVVATPIDLRKIINIKKPAVRVSYELEEMTKPGLAEILAERLGL